MKTGGISVVARMTGSNGDILEVLGDFAAIQEGMDDMNVKTWDVRQVGIGDHAVAYVIKAVVLKGMDGGVISTGPMHPAGLSIGSRLLTGSIGAVISNLNFSIAKLNRDVQRYASSGRCWIQ